MESVSRAVDTAAADRNPRSCSRSAAACYSGQAGRSWESSRHMFALQSTPSSRPSAQSSPASRKRSARPGSPQTSAQKLAAGDEACGCCAQGGLRRAARGRAGRPAPLAPPARLCWHGSEQLPRHLDRYCYFRDRPALQDSRTAHRMHYSPGVWPPDWDLKVGLERARKWRGIMVPNYLRQWINLKVAFGAMHSQCAPAWQRVPCKRCLHVFSAMGWCPDAQLRMPREPGSGTHQSFTARARAGPRAGCMATCAHAWRQPA